MSTLRISDAPLLPDVSGTEKIPTGGRGDYAISVDQIKDHIFQDVGKELVGLGNVDNTSDLDKPVSTAQQAALDLKADKIYVDENLELKADKVNVYTRSETTLALSQKADLVGGVVPANQLPSYVDDVLEFTTATLPIVGESGKIYITTDTNRTWRWSGNQYVEISNGGISDSTLKLQTARKIANVDFDGTQDISIPHNNLTNRNVVNAHTADSIGTSNGENQQDINDYIGAKWRDKAGGYTLNSRVMLDNGYIVRSVVAGNTVNPNVDMMGWMYDEYVYKNYHLVSKWGTKGDGVTQDRLAIQAAIDELHAIYLSTGIVQTLIYEDNKKYVCHQIAIKEGVNHISIGQSTLLKTPATPDETEAGLYWRNIFYPSVNANSILKDRILIENLIFDGNYNNMNWTWGTYNQQQAGNLYMHSADIPSGKRLKYELRNVVLKDSVADGVLVSRNTDVIIRGIKTEDCFRGGVTVVGGNSIIDIDGMIGENANLHIELDGGGNDTDTPYKIIGSFKNISIDKERGLNAPWGGFYYTNSAGSSVNFENVKVYSRNFHIEGTTIGSDLTRSFLSSADFHNCHFIVSGTSRVFFPRGMNFHNCTFKYKMLDDATADNNGMLWYWRTSSGNAPIGQISNFYDCKFIGDTVNGFKYRSAFAVDSTPNSAFGFLNAYRCTFSGFRHGTYAPYGFRGEHHDCIYDSEIGILVGSTTLVGGGSLKFKLKNPTFTKNCTLALSILEALNDGTTELEFVDVSIDRSKLNQANLPTINGTLKGFLEVVSDVAPNPMPASVDTLWGGTRWKVLANTMIPVYEYVNTAANGVKNKDTWLATVFVTKTGNTATRPTLTKFDVGVTYINTETSKIDTWTGSAWI